MKSAASPESAPRTAFWRGFWYPNPLVLVTALLVTGAGLLGLQAAFTSGRISSVAEARFLRTKNDDWGHISWQVAHLKRHPPTDTGVYLLGGSNMRESIETPRDLERAIAHECGLDTEVYVLGSTNQHFGESLAIIDNLPPGNGVVVIGVNQSRFHYPPGEVALQLKGRELLLSSPSLRQTMIDEADRGRDQLTILPGIFNYGSGWLQKNQKTLLRGRLPLNRYVVHRYHQGNIWSPARKASKVEYYLETKGKPGGDFDRYVGFNMAVLAAAVGRAEELGLVPVLLEVPENREIVGDSFARYRDVYQPFCRELAAGHGGYYVDFGSEIGLVNEDFRDLTHLVEPGRAKWTAGLAKALCPAVTKASEGASDR